MVQVENRLGSVPDPSRGCVLRSCHHVAGVVVGSRCFPRPAICNQSTGAWRAARSVLRGRSVDRTKRPSSGGVMCDRSGAPPTEPRATGILAYSESSGHGTSDIGKEFARLDDRPEGEGGLGTGHPETNQGLSSRKPRPCVKKSTEVAARQPPPAINQKR